MKHTKDEQHCIEILECGMTVGYCTPAEALRWLREQDDDSDVVGDGNISAYDHRIDSWLRR